MRLESGDIIDVYHRWKTQVGEPYEVKLKTFEGYVGHTFRIGDKLYRGEKWIVISGGVIKNVVIRVETYTHTNTSTSNISNPKVIKDYTPDPITCTREQVITGDWRIGTNKILNDMHKNDKEIEDKLIMLSNSKTLGNVSDGAKLRLTYIQKLRDDLTRTTEYPKQCWDKYKDWCEANPDDHLLLMSMLPKRIG